jgi:hypothetical protein
MHVNGNPGSPALGNAAPPSQQQGQHHHGSGVKHDSGVGLRGGVGVGLAMGQSRPRRVKWWEELREVGEHAKRYAVAYVQGLQAGGGGRVEEASTVAEAGTGVCACVYVSMRVGVCACMCVFLRGRCVRVEVFMKRLCVLSGAGK